MSLLHLEMKMYGEDEEGYSCEDFEDDCEDGYWNIDGVGFARPGSNSALRAATKDNPRNLPCPTCGEPNRLTPIDVMRGYQCDSCSDKAERGLGWDD